MLLLEITSLGVISKQTDEPFAKYLKPVGVNSNQAIFKCMETIIHASYFIFYGKSKSWTDQESLNCV